MDEIINKLSGKRIKICKNSITIKDDENKTRGVVRDVKKYVEASVREQFDHFKDVKAAGIWGTEYTKNLLIIGRKLYYLNDMRSTEFYKDMVARFNDENSKESLNKMEKMASEAEKYMTVINCRIIC